jgi:3alpha(or 20beta)-hydroxysteroid dehydrogenase
MASASPAFTDAALAEIPLGRVGVPADIAPTVVFLV